MGGYGAADSARLIEEADKTSSRSEFERDRARLVHSAALRRLGAKTQVRTPWRRPDHQASDDFIRTRLTHSLEVAQVGRELGKALGCDPDVVDTACLAHDLGHPPFGHNGERALAQVAEAAGGFEGNAQTLRLLTRLEAKLFAQGRSWGLNLTRACLDASIKYPWRRGQGPPGSDQAKFGVYEPEQTVFEWVRQGAPPFAKCLEAQVMDLADDVAYCVHDVEDGIVGGSIPCLALADGSQRQSVVALAAQRYWSGDQNELDDAAVRLTELDYWPLGWDGSRQALAALKDLTSQLIGRFVLAAQAATRQVYGHGRLTRYAAELVVPAPTGAEIAVLKALAAVFVMEPRLEDPVYVEQRQILKELFGYLLEGAPDSLQPEFQADFAAARTEGDQTRVVVDQLASLTDSSAMIEHRRFTAGSEHGAAAWPAL